MIRTLLKSKVSTPYLIRHGSGTIPFEDELPVSMGGHKSQSKVETVVGPQIEGDEWLKVVVVMMMLMMIWLAFP